MSLKVGIVGLPNVGKSTLFNALLKKRVALVANYPFATIEPNVGVVAVPDNRLAKLAELVAREEILRDKDTKILSDKDALNILISKYLPPIVPAVVEFVDIAGLVKGASTGAGLGNQFLSHIREVDAIVHVLRDFEDPSASSGQAPIIREGSVSPKEDKVVVETELGLSDLQTIEKLIDGQEKQAKVSRDTTETEKLRILIEIKKLIEISGDSIEIKRLGETKDERIRNWFEKLPLLTLKPTLYVYNVSEKEYGGPSFAKATEGEGNEVVISAKLEEELADYSDEERLEYLKTMGIEKTGLERLIIKAYELLGLISYLTAGKKEVRAWTIKKGTKAPQAAAVIHTDFEKGFIRAQVIEYEKLLEAGSYTIAKQKGMIRTEGKEYVIKDGDVVEFLVNS